MPNQIFVAYKTFVFKKSPKTISKKIQSPLLKNIEITNKISKQKLNNQFTKNNTFYKTNFRENN